MSPTTAAERRRLESLDLGAIESHQVERLNRLVDQILPANRFYAEKLAAATRPLTSLAALSEWPLTTKEELVGVPRAGDRAANHTHAVNAYTRFHQTSGTRGRPLVVMDTAEDWQWWIECWQHVLDAAGITSDDRVLMAFSFGPFIGFWSACDALVACGSLVLPGGGMSTLARLELARTAGATAVFCTPSYALHMAETAAANQVDIAALPVRRLVLAGEPGGSVPATRARIESAWQAVVLDHCGATEIGPWGYGDAAGLGLHVLESEFIAEFLTPGGGRPAAEGELSELVLTNLGRTGCPVIRYRTGDLVRHRRPAEGANRFVWLEGGVLGRADDMFTIRGVNVFPRSLDQILRSFPEVVEYRVTVTKAAELDALAVEIEDRLDRPDRVAGELQLRLGLRVDVRCVPLGSLPRFEGKGRRFIDLRGARKSAP